MQNKGTGLQQNTRLWLISENSLDLGFIAAVCVYRIHHKQIIWLNISNTLCYFIIIYVFRITTVYLLQNLYKYLIRNMTFQKIFAHNSEPSDLMQRLNIGIITDKLSGCIYRLILVVWLSSVPPTDLLQNKVNYEE